MRWLTLLALLAGCLPSAPAPPAEAPARPTAANERPDLSDLERRVAHATNRARAGEGLGAYAWSDPLAEIARAHSRDMADRNYFDHTNPDGDEPNDRALARGLDCRVELGRGRLRVGVSENLFEISAYERILTQRRGDRTVRTTDWFTSGEIAGRVVAGWLDSPGHRRNVLDAVSTEQGIGVAVDGDRVFVTQLMC